MNLVENDFDTGIEVSAPAAHTWVDNNSIYLTTSTSPVTFNGSSGDCDRNNIVKAKVPLTLAGEPSTTAFRS